MPVKFEPIKPSKARISNLGKVRSRALDTMSDFVVEAQTILQPYPAPGPWVKKRTNTLQRSWHHEVKSAGQAVEGIVASQGQIAPYNVYVQGPRQKAYHRAHGWKTPKDAIPQLRAKFEGRVKLAIKELAK